jgi:hypothetical protein
MIDYLLKFPNKATAEQFGIANSFAKLDPESGLVFLSLASHTHALHEIGEHNGDGNYWVLFRDLVDIPVPKGGEQFIYWSSDFVVHDDAGSDIPVPRPEFNPDVPNIFWADGSILPNNDPPLPAEPLAKEQIADFKAKIEAQKNKKKFK